jgi:hypothetical protein
MSTEKLPELSFAVEKRAGFLVIDWSLKGGKGCRPANDTELEMLALISALEQRVRELEAERDALLKGWESALASIGAIDSARGVEEK